MLLKVFLLVTLLLATLQSLDCRRIKRDSTSYPSRSFATENNHRNNVVQQRYAISNSFGSEGGPYQGQQNVGAGQGGANDNNHESRIVRQSSSSYLSPQTSPTNSYSSGSQPSYTTYISSPASSSVSSPSSSASLPSSAPSSGSNPLGGLASLFNIGNGATSGLGGVVQTASGGVKTVLEIKRDVIIPLVLGILNFIKNIATSETLQSIAQVKLGAARTALSVGPAFIQALSGIASTAGDITKTLINIFLCNIICPLQSNPDTCAAEASCSSSGGGSSSIGSTSPTKTTYSVSPSQSYIVS